MLRDPMASYQSIFRAGLFEGKVAIVTGAGSGIGRCIAHELSALGATVILAGREEAKLRAVAAEIAEDGGKAHPVACNIREEAAVRALVARSLELGSRLDFVVNNAGGQFVSPVERLSLKAWNVVIETNLNGAFLVSREAVLQTMGERGGAIVNIVADVDRGMPSMAHSGAARAGVINLTKTCAVEWAAKGVRVNAVAPGVIASSALSTNYPPEVQALIAKLPRKIPAGRLGSESEVSAAVAFLLSPGASYITGDVLAVDGASSLGGSLYSGPFVSPSEPAIPEFLGFHRGAAKPARE